jgi:hypothetical protein
MNQPNFIGGQYKIRPKADPLAMHREAQKKAALDALTEDMLADYIKNHLLSRGAPVGSA